MARKSAFAVIVLFLFTFQKVSAVSQANGLPCSSFHGTRTLIVVLCIAKLFGASNYIEEIKARLYATGWPPSVIVSWESQIKLKDVEYKLFYGKSGDFGCQSPADLINAVWCSRNATQSNSQGIFQCDITGAYAELDIFNERSYYNLCVDITASTLSGLHFRSNMVEEELAKTTVCPAPKDLTLLAGKRNVTVTWACPEGVSHNMCKHCVAYKVLLTQRINGSDHCVDEPKEVEVANRTVFTDLDPNTSYNITVCCTLECLVYDLRSCNCNEVGPPTYRTVMTKEDVPQNPPELQSCQAECSNENMAVDLTYLAPYQSTRNGIPRNYTVTYWELSAPANRTKSQEFPFIGKESSMKLTGLDPHARYHVDTCLSTSAGCGPVARNTIGCEICYGILPTHSTVTGPPSRGMLATNQMLFLLILAPVSILLILGACSLLHRGKRSKKSLEEEFEVMVDDDPYTQPHERQREADYDTVVVV